MQKTMQNRQPSNQYDLRMGYPDLIRTIAIYLVILIHVAAGAFYTFSDRWMSSNIYDSFSRIAVPLFFMLSGALLLSKEESLTSFYRKRFWKVVLPLIVWSYIYIFWRVFYHGQDFFSLWTLLISEPVYYHLGFVYMIVSVYIATPILRKYYHASPKSLKLYYILLAFFAAGLLPLLGILFEKPKILGLDLSFFNGWIGYFLLGMFLTEWQTYQYRNYFLVIYGLGSLATIFLTTWWSHKMGTPNELFYIYLSPNIVIAAIGLFCFLKSFEDNIKVWHPKIRAFITQISLASFGMYLIHPIILELFSSRFMWVPLNAGTGNPYIFMPLIALFCFALSFCIIFVLQKLPLVKYIVP